MPEESWGTELNERSGGTECSDPAIAELLGSWELGLLAREEADRFEAHVLVCGACFEELYANAELVERLKGRGELGERLPGPSSAPQRSNRRLWAGALAASVLIVAVLGLLAPWEAGRDDPPRTRGVASDSVVLAQAPIGVVERPARLEWVPVPDALRYELRVEDDRGRSLGSIVVERSPAELPPKLRDELRAGRRFYWQVEAISAGDVRTRSALTEFTVLRSP